MPSVVLQGPSGDEVTVDRRLEFVQLVYGEGWQPKTGSIDDNWILLGEGGDPIPVNELLPVRITDLDDPESEASKRIMAAARLVFASYDQHGNIVIGDTPIGEVESYANSLVRRSDQGGFEADYVKIFDAPTDPRHAVPLSHLEDFVADSGVTTPTPNTVARRNAKGGAEFVEVWVNGPQQTFDGGFLVRLDYMQAAIATSRRRAANGGNFTSYTFALSDEGKLVYSLSSAAVVFTIPTFTDVPFQPGAWIDALGSSGVGTTVQAAPGVTLLSPDGAIASSIKPKAWNATVRFQKLANPDTWLATGDILSETEAAVDAATFSAIPNTLVRRGASAESIFDYVSITQPPNAAAHGTRKDWVDTQIATRVPNSEKGAANGVATLGSDGKLLAAQLPAVAISDFLGAVASQAAMLALTGQRGDWATRTDLSADFILIADNPALLASWRQLSTASGGVSSVAGRTGSVTLSSADLTDATTTGRAVVAATDQAAARTAIGAASTAADQAAGTASLRTLGTGAQQAKPGDWAPAVATDTAVGTVELATPAEAVAGIDATRVMTPASTRAAMGGLLRWWTPEMFGAKGDNVTDDTAAVQAAINAAAAAGGGRIYCSKQYVIAGALQDVTDQNAQLTLPKIDPLSGKQITIEFVGAFNPPPIFSVINPMALPDQQSMLRSTLTAGSGGAMIGGRYAGSSVLNFTHVVVVMKNLTIRMPANPTHTALDFRKCVGAALDQVTVDASNYYVQGQVEMTTATSFAIRMPGNDNGAYSDLGTTAVIGFYNGYEWAEHTHGKMVSAWGCRVGAVLVGTNHASHIDRFMTVECQRGLKWTGPHYLTIDQMDIEQVPSGTGWYASVANVTATDNNFARGSIRYHIVTGGVGPGGEFVREAGLGQFLNCVPLLPTTVRLFDTANTTVAIAANAIVTAPFPAEAYDIENLHDPVTNNDRITIKESGWYKISAQTVFETGTGFRIAFIGKNGTAVANRIATNEHNANSADNTAVQVSTGRIWLVKNDYVVLGLISSAADNWIRGETATWLELERVG